MSYSFIQIFLSLDSFKNLHAQKDSKSKPTHSPEQVFIFSVLEFSATIKTRLSPCDHHMQLLLLQKYVNKKE